MAEFVKTVAFAGIPFGIAMGIYLGIQYGTLGALIAGVPSGLAFGVILAVFGKWQRSRFTQNNPCVEGEVLLRQGPANHFCGREGVGGWLYLTDRRLLFASHKFNLQNHELSIPLEDIISVETAMTAWIVPNGLKLVTGRGSERFVVSSRGAWAEDIQRARK